METADIVRLIGRFHARFACFCLHSYNISKARASSSASVPEQTAFNLELCFCAAYDMMKTMLDLELNKRTASRYASDSSWIMQALCCLFLLRCVGTIQPSVESIPDARTIAEELREAGQIMSDLSSTSMQRMKKYGGHIKTGANVALQRLSTGVDRSTSSIDDRLARREDVADDHALVDLLTDPDLDAFYPFDNLWNATDWT